MEINNSRNTGFVQIVGPFDEGEDIIKNDQIKLYPNKTVATGFVTRIAIHSQKDHAFAIVVGDEISEKYFRIGATNVLELSEVKIRSLRPLQYEPQSTIIDMTYDIVNITTGEYSDEDKASSVDNNGWQRMKELVNKGGV